MDEGSEDDEDDEDDAVDYETLEADEKLNLILSKVDVDYVSKRE